MKNTFSLILVLLFAHYSIIAQKAYEQAIGKNIELIFTSDTAEDMDAIANKFFRIGEAETDKWLPYYYGSLTYIFKSFKLSENADKDEALKNAQSLLDKSINLDSENSENSALQGFLYMISLSVDPASRGQSMSPKAFGAFEKALALKPNNPRALLFKGQMMYGTAQFFGSGTEQACELVSKSLQLFEKEKGQNSILPSWGLKSAQDYKKLCEKDKMSLEEKE